MNRNWGLSILKLRTIAAGAAVASLAAALALAAPAAANPACGATVIHSVKLKSDMDCSASNTHGIIIGKGGLTINLNGHKLIGPDNGSYDGISNGDGYNRTTVKDGTVTGYQHNVLFQYTSGSKVDHIRSVAGSGDTEGLIDFWYSRNGSITHSTASGPALYGIYLYENEKVNLSHSKVVNGDPAGEYGVYDYYSLATLSDVTSNGSAYGFSVEHPYRGYKITESSASGDDEGFYLIGNYPTNIYQATLSHNLAKNNTRYGFYADVHVLGKHNHARHNHPNCFHVTCSK